MPKFQIYNFFKIIRTQGLNILVLLDLRWYFCSHYDGNMQFPNVQDFIKDIYPMASFQRTEIQKIIIIYLSYYEYFCKI